MRPTADQPVRRAFTLIEVIVVVMLLAILSSMIVPRLIGNEGRANQLAADRVADLLIMFAQREALSSRPAGIWLDADRNWIVLVTLDVDPSRPDEPAEWQQDRSVRPVKLPPTIPPDGVLATMDGQPIDIRQWPIATEPGRPRPWVEIALYPDEGPVMTVVLPPHAIAPYLLNREGESMIALREPVDLDATGRHREDW